MSCKIDEKNEIVALCRVNCKDSMEKLEAVHHHALLAFRGIFLVCVFCIPRGAIITTFWVQTELYMVFYTELAAKASSAKDISRE